MGFNSAFKGLKFKSTVTEANSIRGWVKMCPERLFFITLAILLTVQIATCGPVEVCLK